MKCNVCKEIKTIEEFSKGKSVCKTCINKKNRERYHANSKAYLYMIKVDGKIWWIGSTNNIKRRIINHRTNKKQFVDICRAKGLDLEGKNVVVFVCDLELQGCNMTFEDRKYYEHLLIREYRKHGQPLLNKMQKSRFIERERYIDEIPLNSFDFIATELKIYK